MSTHHSAMSRDCHKTYWSVNTPSGFHVTGPSNTLSSPCIAKNSCWYCLDLMWMDGHWYGHHLLYYLYPWLVSGYPLPPRALRRVGPCASVPPLLHGLSLLGRHCSLSSADTCDQLLLEVFNLYVDNMDIQNIQAISAMILKIWP